ncbi:ABC transporter substrate-binding protein [Veillonella sp. R32]|uniref:ABC transporter substrate-binding protein n=1 Tax=Veillonella sp. R32 TaxID=2021312 RepID=UPI00138986FD|nr:ABC transporter substrate-binding protein [Veillonella sp. R32]KAF1682492.1 Fe3+-citrate ABC transporter substrate-binding protein [Veillonella sp. R32]
MKTELLKEILIELTRLLRLPRLAVILLLGIGATMMLAGCGTITSWSITPSLMATTQTAKPLFPADVPRSDTAAAIDAELTARYEGVVQRTNALFTETNGQLILKHKYGTTVIPKEAKRVVVIRLEDPMLALGAPMVGAYNPPTFYLHDELTANGVVPISINENIKAINLEQVQALKPDLILLRDSFDRNAYIALSKIAPVAALRLQDTEVTLLALGKILHREEQANARLQLYYDRVKQARMDIKGRIGNSPVALLRILKKEVRLYPYSTNDINRFMYELLNLTPDPMAVAQDSGDTNVVSLEMLPELKAQYLIVSSGYGPSSSGNNEAAQKRYEELQDDPLWQTIPAVKAGHILNVNPVIWNAHGIIAKERAIEDLHRYFMTVE